MTRPAIHPGEILADELAELGVTPTELSRQINVPPNRVTQIIHGRRGITGDTALRLGHWFGTSAQFWLNLQSAYDIRVADEKAGQEIAQLPTRPPVPLCRSRSSRRCFNDRARDTERGLWKAQRSASSTASAFAVARPYAFAHGVIDGRTEQEFEPGGKAGEEVDRLYLW